MPNTQKIISRNNEISNDYIVLFFELFCCFLFIIAFVYIGLNSEAAHTFFKFFKSTSIPWATSIITVGSFFFLASLLLSIFVILGFWINIDWLNKLIQKMGLSQRRMILIGLTIAICISIVPLFISWSTANPQYSTIGGLIPYSDAVSYYNGAEQLLDTGKLDGWNQYRPLNAVLMAEILLLTNFNFRNALILQAVFFGISAYLAAFAVGRTFCKIAGILLFFSIFSFAAPFLPLTLSEALGISLGSLGFALLWYGVSDKHKASFIVGIVLLTLALSARPGSILILPALILFSGYLFRNGRRYNLRLVVLSTGCTGIGFFINQGINWLYSDGTGAFFSNYARKLYGIAAGGKGPQQVLVDYPQLSNVTSLSVKNAFIYNKAFGLIWSNPVTFLNTLLNLLVNNIELLIQHFTSYCLLLYYNSGEISNFIHSNISAFFPVTPFNIFLVISFFCAIRFFVLYKNKDIKIFFIAGLSGFILSLPFFYTDIGWRYIAATFPFISLLFVMTLLGLSPKSCFQKERDLSINSHFLQFTVPAIICAFIIISACIGPMFLPTLANTIAKAPNLSPKDSSCEVNQSTFLMRIDSGMPYLLIHDETDKKPTFSPDVQNTDMKFVNWEKDPSFDQFFSSKFQPSFSFLLGYDRISHTVYYLQANSTLVVSNRHFMKICAELQTNNPKIYVVKTASVIESGK